MNKLQVLTFSDHKLPEENELKKSCERLGLKLEVLVHSPWEFNAIKIKLLYQYLEKSLPDQMLLVVDALDVILLEGETDILEKFDSLEGDVIFSAESNYYFRNKKLSVKYWKKYPKRETIYDYLNSGSYLGKSSDLKRMVEQIIEDNQLKLNNSELAKVRSDQYLFSKFYVDNYHETESPKIRLDHHHKLFGCTGGRFFVKKFPDLSKSQAFAFFILERNLLKKYNLHEYQKLSKDYEINEGRFFNKKTKTTPGVMHFPGTWENFDKVLKSFTDQIQSRKKYSKSLVAAYIISYISFILSLPFILYKIK